MSLDSLTRRITAYFRKRADKFGLRAETVEARYILNPGGYVNASFFIQDGLKRYHLKLADEDYSLERLARWKTVHSHLSKTYHAPRMLAWLQIPGTDFFGALFEYIPGKPADFAAQPEVLQGVLDLLPRLHSDTALAERLANFETEIAAAEAESAASEAESAASETEAAASEAEAAASDAEAEGAVAESTARTCTDSFLDIYIDRFDGDLMGIVNDLPPFVSLALFDWMSGETRHLDAQARELPAFQHPANAPIHADLWPSNVLVTAGGNWYVIDWDDLSLGDPAADYSILLGPFWRRGELSQAQIEARLPAPLRADPDFLARFSLYLRALLLDEIIDSLADWVESEFDPKHQHAVQIEKERIHREALALYRLRFP